MFKKLMRRIIKLKTISRLEYFILTVGLISLNLALLQIFTMLNLPTNTASIILTVIYIAVIGGLAVGINVSRLHDVGFSGFWLLLMGIPIVNILLLGFMFLAPSKVHNKYS